MNETCCKKVNDNHCCVLTNNILQIKRMFGLQNTSNNTKNMRLYNLFKPTKVKACKPSKMSKGKGTEKEEA